MSLVVVGSVALDDIHTAEDSRINILGGSASYFSMGASLLSPVKLVAVVGEDFPEEHIRLFESRGVDLAGLQRREGKTFHWAGRYATDFTSRETLATDLNVFADFDPMLPESYRNAQHVFLANIHPSLQHKVLDQLASPLFVAADTMNYWIEGTPEELARLLPRLDLLVINDEEVRQLGESSSIAASARRVLEKGPKALVVKRGEHGASLYHEEGTFHLPAVSVDKVRDPTGAGDTFASGFMGYLAGRVPRRPGFEDLKQALAVGTALASFAVEDFSLQRLISLSLEEVYERYQRLARSIAFSPLESLERS